MPSNGDRCPVCGHEPGAAAVVVLADAADPIAPSAPTTAGGLPRGAPRGRRPAIVVVASVGLVAALLAVVDAAATREEAESADPTSTTEPTTTTRRGRPATTTTVSHLAPLLLGEPTGLRLAALTDRGSLIVDLDDGSISSLPSPGMNTWAVTTTPAGLVFVRGDNRALFLPAGAKFEEPIELGAANRVIRSAEPDRVWLILEGQPASTHAVEVALPSREVTAEVTVQPSAWVIDAVAGGLLVSAPGGAYVVDPQRGPRRVSRGMPIAGGADQVLEHRCDDRLRCHLVVHDLGTGVARTLPVPAAVASTVSTAVFSSDGGRLALVSYPAGDLFVFDLSRDEIGASGPLPASIGTARWSPDGQWLFALRYEPVQELVVWRARDGVTHRVSLEGLPAPVHDVVVLAAG